MILILSDIMTGTDINPQTEGDIDNDKLETATADIIIAEDPADCCPDLCYRKIIYCHEDYNPDFWAQWKELRAKTFILIEDKYFETVIITMIMISSLALVSMKFVFVNHILVPMVTYSNDE